MIAILQIFTYWTFKEKQKAYAAIFLIVIMAALEMIGVFSILPFLSLLSNPSSIESNYWLQELFQFYQSIGVKSVDDFLISLGVTSILFIVLSGIFKSFTQYFLQNLVEFSRFSLSSEILRNFLQQPYAYYLDKDTTEMTKIIIGEVDFFIDKIFRPIILGFANLLVAISLILLLTFIDVMLALATFLFVTLIYVILFSGLKKFLLKSGNNLTLALKNRFSSATNSFSAIKTIKITGSEEFFLERFQKAARVFQKSMVAYISSNQISSYIVETIVVSTLFLATIFLILSGGGVESQYFITALPIIGLYGFVIIKIKPLTHMIYQGFTSARYGSASIQNLIDAINLDDPTFSFEEGRSSPLDDEIFNMSSELSLDNISFKYSDSSEFEIKNISLDIQKGHKIGIIGISGSGKSTLIDIILGLLIPTSGTIKIDGINLTHSRLRAWQSKIGYVPQDVFLTNDSLKENIVFHLAHSDLNLDMLNNAISRSHLDDLVSSQAAGHDLEVGDRGIKLSGGQRQRVGIARALYNDPNLIVFDESTSSLDSNTASKIMDSIYMLDDSHTVLIISHQLHILKDCDQIFYLEKGQLQLQGTYEELLKNDALFKLSISDLKK